MHPLLASVLAAHAHTPCDDDVCSEVDLVSALRVAISGDVVWPSSFGVCSSIRPDVAVTLQGDFTARR